GQPLPLPSRSATGSRCAPPFPPPNIRVPPPPPAVPAPNMASSLDFSTAHPTDITLGQTTDGELTAENPALYYSLTAGRDGYIYAQLVTDGGFSPVLGSGIASPATGGGGGGGCGVCAEFSTAA